MFVNFGVGCFPKRACLTSSFVVDAMSLIEGWAIKGGVSHCAYSFCKVSSARIKIENKDVYCLRYLVV